MTASLHRVFNFSAGPAVLPLEVLQTAQAEMLNWQGTGMSVMEMSHRSDEFIQIAATAKQDLIDLLNIPDNYHVLFLQGGASLQFAMVPMNLCKDNQKTDYCQTGIWSQKAIGEAKRQSDVNIAVESCHSADGVSIPEESAWQVRSDAAYLHFTPNETINGVAFPYVPKTNGVPLIADMSSNILSKPIDVSQYGLIYAGAQKNMGPAGITIVIIRKDLVVEPKALTPVILSYSAQVKADSMYNTPPTYVWYLVGLVLKWLKQQGGLAAMAKLNQQKAALLYDTIDREPFYANPVAKPYRSDMNVPFTLAKNELNAQFLVESAKAGLVNLAGHRDVGGMRASIYNAMPLAGVERLVEFMCAFSKKHA